MVEETQFLDDFETQRGVPLLKESSEKGGGGGQTIGNSMSYGLCRRGNAFAAFGVV